MTQNILEFTGIGRDRLHLAWVSSAEAQRFADIATETTELIKKMGKLEPEVFSLEIEAAKMAVSSESIRWLVGKEIKITSEGDVYHRTWDPDQYESLLDSILEREYHKNLIYQAVKQDCTSVREISERTRLDLQRVSYLLADLEKTNMVVFTGVENSIPAFAAINAA